MKAGAKVWRWAVAWVAMLMPAVGWTVRAEDAPADMPVVSLVTDARPGPAAAHGLDKIMEALRAKKIACERVTAAAGARGKFLIIAGLKDGQGAAASMASEWSQPFPAGPEALVLRKGQLAGKPAWTIAGSDDRGVMYGELDVADRIGWGSDPAQPLNELREASEKPAVGTRAVSIYTMNRAYWESRFYDEVYWARYLDTLAQNRFNSLVVIFGYENGGFLAPCYPYFFNVAQFPDVRMVGITAEQQQRNLAALNKLIEMAHARGINFTVGIWDHIYRGGVQGGGVPGADEAARRPTPGLVWGVTGENLVPYTKAALAQFVKEVPKLDAIQFRMHDESGLKPGEQVGFWTDVFKMMMTAAPNLHLDLRAKGLPDSVIQAALETGIKFRITTKYWMEQMGLPYHPTHINTQDQKNRRHSYADLLRYPKQYTIHWRMFNGGTTRVLLWGDPEYARRFAGSTHLYDGDGFEINEPLATKMEGQPHDMKPFELLGAPYRYYDYEFERYWHYFQVFGRVGYNPDTPAEVWGKEFEKRFGKSAAPFVERGLHAASGVLPRIVASDYPYGRFPMTAGWPEKERLGDLPTFARAEGSDLAQFANFDEEARLLIEGGETAKIRPPENSRWFAQRAEEIRNQVAEAEKRIGAQRGKEFDSTMVDLKILAALAEYHARRIPAAVSYRIYARTRDVGALDDAIKYEREATAAWRGLVEAAGDVYAGDLMMGARSRNLCGHWKDELAGMEKGLAALEQARRGATAGAGTGTGTEVGAGAGAKPVPRYQAWAPHEGPTVKHRPVETAAAGQPLTITADVSAPAGIKWVRLRYRGVTQFDDYQTIEMKPAGETGRWQATVPGGQVNPKWDFMYYIEAMDKDGHGVIWPDLNKETPYVVVRLTR